MHRLLALMIVVGCGGSSRPPAPVKTADTVAMADPCDGGEMKEDPCAGGEAKQQVAVADPCDGGEAQGGLGLKSTGEGGGGVGSGPGLGSIGTIGTGSGTGSGYGAARPRTAPPQVTIGKLIVVGKLPADVIRRVARGRINQLRYCYEKLLTARPDLAGALALDLVITPEGDVAQTKASGVTPDLETCVQQSAMKWKFPKPKSGPVKVTIPMTFALPAP